MVFIRYGATNSMGGNVYRCDIMEIIKRYTPQK